MSAKKKDIHTIFPCKKTLSACLCSWTLVPLTFIQASQLFVCFKCCCRLPEFHKRRAWPPSQQHALTKQNVWVFYKPSLLCKAARSLH